MSVLAAIVPVGVRRVGKKEEIFRCESVGV